MVLVIDVQEIHPGRQGAEVDHLVGIGLELPNEPPFKGKDADRLAVFDVADEDGVFHWVGIEVRNTSLDLLGAGDIDKLDLANVIKVELHRRSLCADNQGLLAHKGKMIFFREIIALFLSIQHRNDGMKPIGLGFCA